jgi:hypothetical protein
MNNMEITASYIIVRDLREKLLGYLVLKSSKRMFVCSKKKGRNRAKKFTRYTIILQIHLLAIIYAWAIFSK